MPADLATLDSVINHLHAFYDPLLTAGRGIVTKKNNASNILKESTADTSKKKGTSELTNRIRYNMNRSAYIVVYSAADSTIHRISKGLEVPKTDVMGKPLDKQTYASAKKAKLKKAKETWNQFDQSYAPRFKV